MPLMRPCFSKASGRLKPSRLLGAYGGVFWRYHVLNLVNMRGLTPRLYLWGCPGFDWYGSGCRLQVERSSPDWAKNLTANNDSYAYALAA